jgi:hypothetical protein
LVSSKLQELQISGPQPTEEPQLTSKVYKYEEKKMIEEVDDMSSQSRVTESQTDLILI